jgi:hypothetical protein
LCVFLRYSTDYKCYKCLDFQSNRIIISRHVVFDEFPFPFAEISTTSMSPSCLDFLVDDNTATPAFGSIFLPAGSSGEA